MAPPPRRAVVDRAELGLVRGYARIIAADQAALASSEQRYQEGLVDR